MPAPLVGQSRPECSSRYSFCSVETDVVPPQLVELGIRLFPDKAQDLFGVVTERCPDRRRLLFNKFDDPVGGGLCAEPCTLDPVQGVGEFGEFLALQSLFIVGH